MREQYILYRKSIWFSILSFLAHPTQIIKGMAATPSSLAGRPRGRLAESKSVLNIALQSLPRLGVFGLLALYYSNVFLLLQVTLRGSSPLRFRFLVRQLAAAG